MTRIFTLLILAGCSLFSISVKAQYKTVDQQIIAEQLDSAYLYYLSDFAEPKLCLDTALAFTDSTTLTDSVYAYRLQQIPSAIPLDYNNITQRFIELYTVKKRYAVPGILAQSQYYFPQIEAELSKEGLPLELKYMAVIESAINNNAVSRAGAVGMWQFMYPTAKIYNLELSSFVDERRDFLAATRAACRYMANMYKVYGDWHLAIAAYNCGPGNVNKAIRRSGGKHNFWEIYHYLPRETRGYVPAFIAANYLFAYHQEHQLLPAELDIPLATDSIMVHNMMHFQDIADSIGLGLDTLKALNPHYIKQIVPASASQPRAIVLPVSHLSKFIDKQDNITLAYVNRTSQRATGLASSSSRASSGGSGTSTLHYTVKYGDNLGYIADWYDTRVSSIKGWNGLYSNMIKPGQKLVIYVPESKVSHYAGIDNMSFAEKQGNAESASSTTSANSSGGGVDDYIYHKVAYGESVWKIVQRYPGNSVQEVIDLNQISNSRGLQPGDVIKLRTQ